jgi:DUF3025 family protein
VFLFEKSTALEMRSFDDDWRPRAWAGPLFWPIAKTAALFADHTDWPSVADYDALLGPLAGVGFRRAGPKRRRRYPSVVRRSYDACICEDGVVPARAHDWHDFFNALVWAAFPRAKRALHRRQHAAGETAERRTRERDGLALLDEGGTVLLCARAAVAGVRAALDARDLGPIHTAAREGALVGVIYGHAVYEHVARGAPPVRAMVHLAACDAVPPTDDARRLAADEALAGALGDAGTFLDPDAFRSLPVTEDVFAGGQRPSHLLSR